MGRFKMDTNLKREIEDLENVIVVCFGQPTDMDLPQIADESSIIVELMQDISGMPYGQVEAQYHHQIDPAYVG